MALQVSQAPVPQCWLYLWLAGMTVRERLHTTGTPRLFTPPAPPPSLSPSPSLTNTSSRDDHTCLANTGDNYLHCYRTAAR